MISPRRFGHVSPGWRVLVHRGYLTGREGHVLWAQSVGTPANTPNSVPTPCSGAWREDQPETSLSTLVVRA